DVPGANPSMLVVALGKDGKAYLLNRGNLGGITAPVASLQVSGSSIIQAAATYRTNQGTYVAFRANGNTLSTFRINPGNPPTITPVWTASQSGCGSPLLLRPMVRIMRWCGQLAPAATRSCMVTRGIPAALFSPGAGPARQWQARTPITRLVLQRVGIST